ncbi:MAG TPA: DUF1801 domain-containing protein [Glaciihabitans sp.]|jgi:hypothetical protein|nr:DUF1801 domain-containing protein [Glaciihabitans sp.]
MEKTATDPNVYIDSADEEFRADLRQLDAEITAAFSNHDRTMWEGVFWGGTEQRIIGYGSLVQARPRKQSIEWFIVGLAAQKQYISLYVNVVEDGHYLAEKLASRLGRVKVGKSVISFRSLAEVNREALSELIAAAAASKSL